MEEADTTRMVEVPLRLEGKHGPRVTAERCGVPCGGAEGSTLRKGRRRAEVIQGWVLLKWHQKGKGAGESAILSRVGVDHQALFRPFIISSPTLNPRRALTQNQIIPRN